MKPQYLHAPAALLGETWHKDIVIEILTNGLIGNIISAAIFTENNPQLMLHRLTGPVIPGMCNIHSHSFQYAMLGYAQSLDGKKNGDDFWGWRESMYSLAAKITPETQHAIATQLYTDMLKGGFTAVAEFHYLHHQTNGSHHSDTAQLSHSILSASNDAGIAIRHLPVLYNWSGFGSQKLQSRQLRFANNTEEWIQLIEGISINPNSQQSIGLALHSLRAVNTEQLKAADTLSQQMGNCPIHIHISEQLAEVESSLQHFNKRPVEHLYHHVNLDSRWCLIHATHLSNQEVLHIAQSGAIAGICPTTEADLGDGIFPADSFIQAHGSMAIGTDSHINTHVPGEIRMLEWSQRLKHKKRLRLQFTEQGGLGTGLYAHLCKNGAQALARNCGEIQTGMLADLVVLDHNNGLLAEKPPQAMLDSWLFSGDSSQVNDVMVAGQWKIKDGQHAGQVITGKMYRDAMKELHT